MAKKLKKLRIREVSLCQRGMNQHAEIVLHKAADPAPANAPATVDMVKALRDASPETLEIFQKMIDGQKQWLEKFQQSHEEPKMTNDPQQFYNALVREHMTKADMTFQDAAIDIQKRRPDKVAEAYTLDEHNRALRMQAEQQRMYGA